MILPVPVWETCWEPVQVMTVQNLGGAPEGVGIPDAGSDAAADRYREVPGSRLVVDAAGSWFLDGVRVDELPPLDSVVLLVDPDLGGAEVVRLLGELHESGARVLVVRRPHRRVPEGVGERHSARRMTEALGECEAGRALLQAGSCAEVETLWTPAVSSPECNLGWWGSNSPDHPRAAVTFPGDIPITLQTLEIDPDRPTFWSEGQTFGGLTADEGWVVIGKRPGPYLRVHEDDVLGLPGGRGAVGGKAVRTARSWSEMPDVCEVRVWIESDQTVSRIDRLSCDRTSWPIVREALNERIWSTPLVGSERPHVVVDVTIPVRAQPAIYPSVTTRGTLIR